ncbi:MAG: class I SAM-dependent methyltransferase [Halobacteriota archaeon]
MDNLLHKKTQTFLMSCTRTARKAFTQVSLHVRSSKPKARKLALKSKRVRLNLGSGRAHLTGWINVDIESNADLVHDIRRGLPFESNSADFIYNEHFIEHLSFDEATKMLRECFRCLKVGGVLRVATPDLGYILHKYDTDWSDQDWLSRPEHETINTKGKMINASFRWWGHRYLYDEDDLREQLARTGFTQIQRCTIHESDYEDLRNLETRQDSTLIIEASKEGSGY